MTRIGRALGSIYGQRLHVHRRFPIEPRGKALTYVHKTTSPKITACPPDYCQGSCFGNPLTEVKTAHLESEMEMEVLVGQLPGFQGQQLNGTTIYVETHIEASAA